MQGRTPDRATVLTDPLLKGLPVSVWQELDVRSYRIQTGIQQVETALTLERERIRGRLYRGLKRIKYFQLLGVQKQVVL